MVPLPSIAGVGGAVMCKFPAEISVKLTEVFCELLSPAEADCHPVKVWALVQYPTVEADAEFRIL
jgi:hypothetical protein